MVNSTTRAFGSPLRYIQGAGEVDNIREYTKEYGKAFFLIDGFLYDDMKNRLEKIYGEEAFFTISCEGECCEGEVDRICEEIEKHEADIFIGIGGGKTLDISKLCADKADLPIVIVPSAASTDAAVSEISVLYTEQGEYVGSKKVRSNANLVLVDTEIIVNAPKRLFIAGIGDALATWFEAKACRTSDSPNYIGTGFRRCIAGMAIAEHCHKVLFKDTYKALDALERKVVTEAFENVVEANVLLSGLGFLNTGLATAHGVHSGLTVIPEANNSLHGEKVAFGVLCQMILENEEDESINELIEFMHNIGLPITLNELNVEASEDNISKIAEKVIDGPLVHHEGFLVTYDSIFSAITVADEIGSNYIEMLES